MVMNFHTTFAQLPSGYNLIWSDEFNGTSLDPNEWGWGQKPWNTQDNGAGWIYPEDTYLENGSLVLRSRRGNFDGGKSYATGWSYTKTWRRYGYIEIRAKYPAGEGQWPAWWMLSTGWPPEIDCAEYRGNPKGYMTYAYYDGAWFSKTVTGNYTDWHTYGLLWEPGSLKFYYDGAQVHSVNRAPDVDLYVILSAGLDKNENLALCPMPSYYKIDYIRWYQKPPVELNGRYTIVNRKSGKCLRTLNQSTADGAEVVQYDCNGDPSSEWDLVSLGGGEHHIINVNSGKYADVQGASTSTGAKNIIWTENGGNNQKWKIVDTGDGYYNIINVNSGLLLDIAGGSVANNANNIQWTANGGQNQQWSFESVSGGGITGSHTIINRKSGKCLRTLNSSTADGTFVVQYDCDGAPASEWNIVSLGGGEYNIINVNSGKYADIQGASTSTGAKNIIWTNNGGNNQKWRIVDIGGGYYNIINVNSGLLLDIQGASIANNANNIQWTANGGQNQQWSFGSFLKSAKINDTLEDELSELTDLVVLYPNPVNNLLNIKLTKELSEGTELNLYDASGRVLKTESIKNSNHIMDMTNLSSGIYLLKITNGSNSITKRVAVK